MKKKSMTRLLALGLTAVMACGSLTGCGKDNGDGGNSSGSQSQSSSQSGSGESGSAADGSGSQNTASSQQTEPVKIIARGYNNVENKADNEKIRQKIIEESGIDFEYVVVPIENWSDMVNMKIATSEEFDMLNIVQDNGNWSMYYQKEAIQPINELLEKYGQNILKAVPEEAWKCCTDSEGNIYALPRKELFTKGGVPCIRQDWLDALNMEMPDNKEELEAYFAAVMENDLNGNGIQDEIPYIPYANNLLNTFRPYYLGFIGDRYLTSDGDIQPWYAHENAFPMLETLQKWYKNGWLYKEYLTVTTEQIQDLVRADRLAFASGWYNAPVAPSVDVVASNPDSRIEWSSVPAFTDAPAGGVSAWSSNPVYSACVVLSGTSQNAEWAIRLIDWMFASTENYMLCTYGIEGEHWEYADDTKTTFRLLDGYSEKYNKGYYQLQEWFDESIYPAQFVDETDYSAYSISKMQKTINNGIATVEAFDYFVPYDLTGTDAEMLNNDAETMIEEAAAKVINGEYGEADWDKAVKTAMEIDGSIRSRVWTEQYHEFTGE